jgi:protein ERP2
MILILSLISTLFGITFNIPSGGEICFAEDLDVGEAVKGLFQVVSEGERNIDFTITGPVNDTILKLTEVSSERFSFTGQNHGVYAMCAKNPATFSSKKLSLISTKISKSELGVIKNTKLNL